MPSSDTLIKPTSKFTKLNIEKRTTEILKKIKMDVLNMETLLIL